MTDWPATLAICRRELEQGRCCLGLHMQAAGWCSVDRHKDEWEKCGMEMPDVQRNPDRPGGEPTREDVLAAFREEFRRREFPDRATDAEIQAVLFKCEILDGVHVGPGHPARRIRMTEHEWKFWVHWDNLNPSIREKPALSGKRAFVQAAREAFGIGIPAPNRGAAIETLALPVAGEVLPPEGDTLIAAFSGLDEQAPWTGEENDKAAEFEAKFRRGAAYFVECGTLLIEVRHEMVRGRFIRWIEERLPISKRTAQQFMQIARDGNIRRYVENANHDSLLPPDKAILTELCGMEPEQFDSLAGAGVIHAEMRRGDLKRHLVQAQHGGTGRADPPALPDGKYGVILADPPWAFETRGEGGKGRSAENHYPTMSVDEIGDRIILDLAADDCALFLWVTSDRLPAALDVMTRLSFRYASTAFVWVKEGAPGLGYWTRKGAELCLLGARGSPKRLAADVAEVVHAPRGRHSEKPEEVYERIERLVAGPYLELFARKPRPGWDAWGNDPALAVAG